MPCISRREMLSGLTFCTVAAAQPALGQTAVYPSRPIKVIVPFPAGGAADITMRLIGPKMAEALGQPVVVENRPGANGSVGATAVARADGDGHTLLFAPREVFSVNLSLQASPGYDPLKDLAPIGIATEGPYLLVAHPSLGISSVAAFLSSAKSRELSYASFGIGSMGHLNVEALAQHAGVNFLHVPFRGAPPALQAVVAGDVGFTISTPPNAQGFVADGKIIALAVGAEKRLPQLPDVPTLSETGIPAHVLTPAAFAMAAPRGISEAMVTRLNGDLNRALKSPDVTAALALAGLTPVGGGPEKLTKMIVADGARFAAQIKALKITPQ